MRFCDECKPDAPVKPSRWERAKNDPIMAQFSTTRWARFRQPVIQQCPMCAECHITTSAVADHKIPARLIVRVCRWLKLFPLDRWGGFYIRANMQGLSHSCHNKKTKVEDTQDWTDELIRVLGPFMRDKGIADDQQRERIVEAAASAPLAV